VARATSLALARVLAAAAWADGRVEPDEANAIKTYMLRAGLGQDDMHEVASLLDSPVPQSQAEELVREFLAAMTRDADIQILYEEVETLLRADGELSSDEARFLSELREMLESHSVVDVVLDKMRGLFSVALGSLRPRGRSSAADALRSRVQDRVRSRMAEGGDAVSPDLDRAALFGALLQKVAVADGRFDASESVHIGEVLRDRFGFSEAEVDTMTAALGEQITAELDLQRLTSELNRVTDHGDRVRLLEALFTVAASDGEIHPRELETARRIADFLWIDRRTFHDTRQRVVRSTDDVAD
jgi:uncharacterized tellurite resistance protein B-like protein